MALDRQSSHGPKRTVDTLVDCIYQDLPINDHTVIVDYGVYNRKQYEAIFYAVRSGDITADDLHRVAGDGPGLTELLQSAPNNPHKNVTFKTVWDDLVDPDQHEKSEADGDLPS